MKFSSRRFHHRRSELRCQVRRQSTDKYDLFYGHIGAMDTMALALKIAARMIEDGELDKRIAQRYSGWNSELGQQILKGQMSWQI
ncbi:D-xylose isomerase [Escherichia coli]|uniref:D-xylose isomerase n=1 Tax=Escherichia coli TaxID=562 RepID=A0A376MKS2_ECOLX|nr:D-xylose isomerase [Escherichia coli]